MTIRNKTLPTILIAAVLQGWALYGLHHSLKHQHWPATDWGWLVALYALAVLVPATVQMLAEHVHRRVLWLLTIAIGIALFYFGWHFGRSVGRLPSEEFRDPTETFVFAFELALLWLLALPFLQSRLAEGHWRVEYRALFTFAWRNKIALGEAAIFTGLFWLLLGLWQALFHMLQIDFFRDLFQEPIFVYPITALVFGLALHLIGSIDRLISAVLEQLLNVFKWLATVAGVLLALFTLALVVKLPNLVFEGHKAIGAAWLLWLVAVVVLFLNAAYRDGTILEPYPRWIAQALRFVVPLTVVIALTALYGLAVREQHYGLTVERFWAFVVAGAALLYSIGYSVSAVSGGAWLSSIARVNVLTALVLVAVISLALTPLASPYRLAANSQYHRILANRLDEEDKSQSPNRGETVYKYLRWRTGNYGRRCLEELARLQNHPDAERIRALASAALQEKNRWDYNARVDTKALVASLPVYPTGRTLDGGLTTTLIADIDKSQYMFANKTSVAGLYVDLNGDGTDEFVLFGCCGGVAYEHRAGGWTRIGDVRALSPGSATGILTELKSGSVRTMVPTWRELVVGGHVFRVDAKP